jgi:dsRNA-specific ribonuclease
LSIFVIRLLLGGKCDKIKATEVIMMPTKQEITARMRELAEKLSYPYKDISHLARAMYCKKQRGYSNYTNDAMATVGDAVMKLIWSELFYSMGLDKDEITRRKADMENNRTLKNLCDIIEAHKFAYNDRYFATEAPKHRPLPHYDHDFYMEAIAAAIYQDRGLAYTREWAIRFFEKHKDAIVAVKR